MGNDLYGLAADGLVVLHLVFVLFVLGGGVLVWKNRKWAFLHLPAALWGAVVEFTGWDCPLTPLENRLRRLSGGSGYQGDFVEQYLLPLLYPEALTREMQIGLGLLVVAVNVLWYRQAFRRRRPAPGPDSVPAPDSNGPDNP